MVIIHLFTFDPAWLKSADAEGAVAKVRYHLFAKPAGACPMLPPAHRKRFAP